MKMWKRKPFRNDSRRPLINNNNDDGFEQPGTRHVTRNTLNIQEEQSLQSEEHIPPQITLQELAEPLGVAPDADTSEDGSCCSMQPKLNAQQQRVRLIQRSVHQHFPKPPSDVHQNLPQHLLTVQETVLNELLRLAPLLGNMELMGCLIDCYHRRTFDHLNDLLPNIRSAKKSFVLMTWVQQTYLSQEFLGHPDLQKMDPMKKVDLLLFSEVAVKAKDKLIENVQEEVKGSLEKILQHERCEDDYEELYVDTIQCISAKTKAAQHISPELSDEVQRVCFHELKTFLKEYTEILGQKCKMDKPEMRYFFKTLRNCEQLKKFVQAEGKSIPLNDVVGILENMEDFTLKFLMKIVEVFSKSHLQKYFKSKNREYLLLLDAVKSHFSELSGYEDTGIPKRVMGQAYKSITHIYLRYLIQSSQSKLRRCWSPNVAQTVAEDAELLHKNISHLAPSVQQWNFMLLKVTELLECDSTDMMKLTAGSMQEECCNWEDQELLPEILQWKGLSKKEVREVLFVLEDLPSYRPRPTSNTCFFCWC